MHGKKFPHSRKWLATLQVNWNLDFGKMFSGWWERIVSGNCRLRVALILELCSQWRRNLEPLSLSLSVILVSRMLRVIINVKNWKKSVTWPRACLDVVDSVATCSGRIFQPNFFFYFFKFKFLFFEWKLLLGLVIISGFLDNLDVNGRCRPTPSTGVVLRFGRFPVRFGREIERLARFRLWPAGKCLARVNVRVCAQKRATK